MKLVFKWVLIIVIMMTLITVGKIYYEKNRPLEYNDFINRNVATFTIGGEKNA